MKKILTMTEALDLIKSKTKTNEKGESVPVYNRFNKKNFEELLRAMLNDLSTKITTVKVKGDDVAKEEIYVTKEIRKFLQKILRTAGIDAEDSKKILSEDFVVDSVDGLYEFMCAAVQFYMNSGNKFDFIQTDAFKGTIYTVPVAASKKVSEVKNPKDGKPLGTYETIKKDHIRLAVKSTCPKFLTSRKKIK